MHAHVGSHIDDDRVEALRLAGNLLLRGKRQVLVATSQVDEPLQNRGTRLPQYGIPRRPKERIEAALEMQYRHKDSVYESLDREPGAAVEAQNVFKNSMSAYLSWSLSPFLEGPISPGSRKLVPK